MTFDLGLCQAQRRVLAHDECVQADSASGHREIAKGLVLVREREILARVEPVAGDDQAHGGLMRADQCAGELAAQLQRRVDAALDLAGYGIAGHGTTSESLTGHLSYTKSTTAT